MKRFRNILYILDADDGQEQQVMTAVQSLARTNDASIRLVRVVEDTLLDSVGKQFSSRLEGLVKMERQHAAQEIDKVLTAPGWEGLRTSGEILIGKDFITVIRKVLSEEHDLVVKGRKSTEEHDQFAMRLFRKCPCPVWIIDPTGTQPFRTIIGAVDLAGEEKESWQLNRKIVELTHSLAAREGGVAHYLHAWHLEYEKSLRGPRFKVSDEEIELMKGELVAGRRARFEQLFHETGIAPDKSHIHLLEGNPSTIIRRQLESLGGDVLVMGPVARTGLPGLLIGNKAEEVLGRVRCTVLAVKPFGFVSPVTL